eukprot:PLAT214.5.p1 GENE.PLAT214.5~~PLAT214.5.p1  ORF type:complete len:563 (-),score=214.62 PLAT214.5:1736-3424(-)
MTDSAAAAVVGGVQAPDWVRAPTVDFRLDVFKAGVQLSAIELRGKGAWLLGRRPDADIVLLHESCSRSHALIVFNEHNEAFLFDLGSSHGTFVNRNKVDHKVLKPLRVGDNVRFGVSSRQYVLDGPAELMPEEEESERRRAWRAQLERRRKRAAAAADRAKALQTALSGEMSWGMSAEAGADDGEEEKTVGSSGIMSGEAVEAEITSKSVHAKDRALFQRMERKQHKMAMLKRENDRILAKEAAQGGLTDGQQNTVDRNSARLQQLADAVEDLQEQLKERSRNRLLGKLRGKGGKAGRAAAASAVDYGSDDDEYYDRTAASAAARASTAAAAAAASASVRRKRQPVVQTYESLTEQMSGLKQQRAAVQARLQAVEEEIATAAKEDAASGKHEHDEEDELASFMAENTVAERQSRKAELNARLKELSVEEAALQKLLLFAQPAFKRVEEQADSTIAAPAAPAPPSAAALVAALSGKKAEEEKKEAKRRAPGPMLPPAAVPIGSRARRKRSAAVAGVGDMAALLPGSKKRRMEEQSAAAAMAKWKPPAGQSGDGRTALNEKYGY